MIKLWLDDVRTPPDESWTWAKNVHDAWLVLTSGNVIEASLDHDLGAEFTGYDLVCWMEEKNIWPSRVTIHSHNPSGGMRMFSVCQRHTPSRYAPAGA